MSWIVEVDDVVWSPVDGAKTGPSMAGVRPVGNNHPLAPAPTLASAIAETNAE